MAIKVTKGQICDGTISKNKCHQGYYLCEKFHYYEKVHNFVNFGGYAAILTVAQVAGKSHSTGSW